MDVLMYRQMYGWRYRHTDRHTVVHMNGYMDGHTDIWTYRKTDKWADGQKERLRDGQRRRQTNFPFWVCCPKGWAGRARELMTDDHIYILSLDGWFSITFFYPLIWAPIFFHVKLKMKKILVEKEQLNPPKWTNTLMNRVTSSLPKRKLSKVLLVGKA